MNQIRIRRSALSLAVLLSLLISSHSYAAWVAGNFGNANTYNDTANWVSGVIDDVVGPDVIFNATNPGSFGRFDFNADHATGSSGMSIDYTRTGNASLFLDSIDGTPRTVTLNGNFSWLTAGSSKTGGFGKSNTLNLDLGGGDRTINIAASSHTFQFYDDITNGSLTSNTTGPIDILGGTSYAGTTTTRAGTLRIRGNDGAISSSTSLEVLGGILQIGETSNSTNANRIGDSATINLKGGFAQFQYGSTTTSVTENTGAIVLEGVGKLDVTNSSGSQNFFVQADNLNRTNRSIGQFSGNMGTTSSKLLFDAAPPVIGGGGGDGTTNISVVPFLVAGPKAAPTLMTYGANGLRALNTSTEYVVHNATSITTDPATITSANADDNLRVVFSSNQGFNLSSNQTFNSLTFQGLGGNTLGGAAVVTATSGVVAVAIHNNPFVINFGGINFGSAEGLITVTNDQGTNGKLRLNTILSGSNGVTFSGLSGVQPGNPNFNKIELVGDNTYTGQTTINNIRVQTLSSERIPDSSVVSMHDISELNLGGSETIAGLNGGGEVVLNSNTLVMGQATGDLVYAGIISGAGGVSKFAANTQTLNGNNTYTGTTDVSGGSLLVNGTTASQLEYNITTSGLLGGNGTLGLSGGQAVNVDVDSTLAPGNSIGTLTVNGDVNLDGTLELEIDGANVLGDRLIVNGSLTLGPDSTLYLEMLSTLDPKTRFVLAEFDTLSGSFGTLLNVPSTHFLLIEGSQLLLAPVPEPSSLGLVGIAMTGLMLRRRRRS